MNQCPWFHAIMSKVFFRKSKVNRVNSSTAFSHPEPTGLDFQCILNALLVFQVKWTFQYHSLDSVLVCTLYTLDLPTYVYQFEQVDIVLCILEITAPSGTQSMMLPPGYNMGEEDKGESSSILSEIPKLLLGRKKKYSMKKKQGIFGLF